MKIKRQRTKVKKLQVINLCMRQTNKIELTGLWEKSLITKIIRQANTNSNTKDRTHITKIKYSMITEVKKSYAKHIKDVIMLVIAICNIGL